MSEITNEQIESIEQDVVSRLEDGSIVNVTVDGTSVAGETSRQQLDALERLEDRRARKNASALSHFGLRMTRLVPPGGGGR